MESPFSISIFYEGVLRPIFEMKLKVGNPKHTPYFLPQPNDKYTHLLNLKFDPPLKLQENLSKLFPKGRKKGDVCFVLTFQIRMGTGYLNRLFFEQTGEYAANFLLKQVIEHAKSQGFRGIALLKPKNNRTIVFVDSETRREKMARLERVYGSIAEKFGFKYVENDSFWWLIFDE